MIKNYALIIFAFLLLVSFSSRAQDWLWVRSAVGGTVGEGWDVAADTKGDAYISGFFIGDSIQFGSFVLNGNSFNGNMYLVKYDSTGNVLWARTALVDSPGCEGLNVATDGSNNAFITGIYYSAKIIFGTYTLTQDSATDNSLFVVKYSENGDVLWAHQGIGYGYPQRITTDKDGNVYVTGVFTSSSITFGSYTLINTFSPLIAGNAFFVKYDAAGNVKWAKLLGTSAYVDGSSFFSAISDSLDNIYLTGKYGDSIRLGSYFLTDSNGYNFFVVKYDSSGKVLWASAADNDPGLDEGGCISTDAAGNAYVTGIYFQNLKVGNLFLSGNSGGGDFHTFILKYSPSGIPIWARSIDFAFPYVISSDKQGAFIISGSVLSDPWGNYKPFYFGSVLIPFPANATDPMFVIKCDSLGNFICGSILASGGDDNNSVAILGNGNAYITGDYIPNDFHIGNITLQKDSATEEQVFLAKFSCPSTDDINTLYSPSSSLNVFPNPTSNTLYIIASYKEGVAEVTNLLGQVVSSTPFTSTYFEIPVANLSSGIYLIHLKTSEGDVVRKWVKE